MSVLANFAGIYLLGMRDRSMPSGTGLERIIFFFKTALSIALKTGYKPTISPESETYIYMKGSLQADLFNTLL